MRPRPGCRTGLDCRPRGRGPPSSRGASPVLYSRSTTASGRRSDAVDSSGHAQRAPSPRSRTAPGRWARGRGRCERPKPSSKWAGRPCRRLHLAVVPVPIVAGSAAHPWPERGEARRALLDERVQSSSAIAPGAAVTRAYRAGEARRDHAAPAGTSPRPPWKRLRVRGVGGEGVRSSVSSAAQAQHALQEVLEASAGEDARRWRDGRARLRGSSLRAISEASRGHPVARSERDEAVVRA